MAKAYLGSTQLKKAYIGSSVIKKIYRGSILIWSGYQDETLAQKVRIEADGGTIIDLDWIDLVISTLKTLGIYSNCKLLTDANFGVKKDITGAVSKLYDISGNNNDAIQTTGASQPIWSLVNGKGVITYDGVGDCLKITQYTLNVNHSVLFELSWNGVTPYSGIFGKKSTLSYIRLGQGVGSELTTIFGETDTNADNISLVHAAFALNTKYKLCLQQNSNQTWNLYSNSINISQSTASTNPALSFTNIGAGWSSTAQWSGNINSFSVFNILLTTDQMSTLNNL